MNTRAESRSVPSILPILGAACLIRLIGLGARPMWYDEALTVMQSQRGLGPMLYGMLTTESGVASKVHPILYHTLLWIWEQVVGTEPAPVRVLSALLGVGVVVLGYLLARQLFADRVATLTGWALTLSPFHVHYSQEARMYVLLALLLLGATLVYWRAVHRGRWMHWLMFAILAAAAEYAHDLAVVYLVPLCATAVILRRWKQALHTLEAGLLALVLYLPWLLRLPPWLARLDPGYTVPRPEMADLVRTFLVFLAGFPIPPWTLSVAVFSMVFLFVLAIVTTVRVQASNPVLTRRAVWIAYLGVAPVALMFLASWVQPAYLDRALLASGAAFLIWIVWALDRKALAPGLVYLGYAAVGVSFIIGLVGFFSYRGVPYAPFQRLDAYLAANRRAGEVILHSSKLSAIPAFYYDPTLPQLFLADSPQSADHTLTRSAQEMLGIDGAENVQDAVGDANGVWFIVFAGEIEDGNAAEGFGHPTLTWLGTRYSVERMQAFGDLQVYHFVRPDQDSLSRAALRLTQGSDQTTPGRRVGLRRGIATVDRRIAGNRGWSSGCEAIHGET